MAPSCNCKNASSDSKTYAEEVCTALMKTDFALLERIADVICRTKETGSTIFTAGNGGSAASASHVINDLTKGCRLEGREGFRTVCLNDSSVLVTCLANDFCYEDVYSILLKTLAKPGDVLIVYSGSGNSPNIVSVCRLAREMGVTVVGFGGRDGGKMKPLCDYCLLAPTDSMEQLEDLHVVYFHSLVCTLKEKLRTTWDMEIVRFPQPKHSFETQYCDSVLESDVPGQEEYADYDVRLKSEPSPAAEEGFTAFCMTTDEIQRAKAAGGYVVGVAYDPDLPHHIHDGLREQMLSAGADLIVPDLTNVRRLADFLYRRG